MRVPVVIFGSEVLVAAMEERVYAQAVNVAKLPGIVNAVYVMPDAHWGYGFPIGGVAAFDPEARGVVSAGGVGFDISCGVRCLLSGLTRDDLRGRGAELAAALFQHVPSGLGRTGRVILDGPQMDAMLVGGARWAVERGWGQSEDLERIEDCGCVDGARPQNVSARAKARQREQMGTLGSGNHYLEVQEVAEIFDEAVARAFGLKAHDIVIMIHCGSRGLGHQIGTEFLRKMAISASRYGIELADRELACAPLDSSLGRDYLGALRAAVNCALANRQILTDAVRRVFRHVLPQASITVLYDVSHNTCKLESHIMAGTVRRLYVHRKGATRALGPGHSALPGPLRAVGQPVLIGGSMGTGSYILVGSAQAESRAFSSACHGAGRAMSRHQAAHTWRGQQVLAQLAQRSIIVRSATMRGIAEEAPEAYKDVTAVVEATEVAGLARKVSRLEPLICIKG